MDDGYLLVPVKMIYLKKNENVLLFIFLKVEFNHELTFLSAI